MSEHGGSVLRQQNTCEVQGSWSAVRQSRPQCASVLSQVGSYLGQRGWSASLLRSARYILRHMNRHVLHCWNLQCRIVYRLRKSQVRIFKANSRLNRCSERVFSQKRLLTSPRVCPSVPMSAWNSLASNWWISWNLIFDYFSKICRENSSFIKIWQEYQVLYIKANINFWFSEWEIFRTKVVEKIKIHIFCSITFSKIMFFCEICVKIL
jgi:hypothetical protein